MVKKKSNVKIIDNLKLYCNEGYVAVSVNPKIYPIDIVYSASYVFMDSSFVVLDGNPEKKIIVKLRPKDKNKKLEELGRDFNDELLNYAVYNVQSEKNKIVKEAIVQKALFTNQGESAYKDSIEAPFEEETIEGGDPLDISTPWEEAKEDIEKSSEEDSYIDDPLGIAKPWSEAKEDIEKSSEEESYQSECVCEGPKEIPSEEESYIDDPLGIAKPWSEPSRENKTNRS